MPRAARLVVVGIPHHITHRGNRCQNVFFSDDDKEFYIRLLGKWSHIAGIASWAYCLMDNHVHLIAVPEVPESFARGLGETHKVYTKAINERQGWRGFLWQGRFRSYPMDEPYVYQAIRYTELNPVRAGMVARAEDYPWSSARAHVLGEENPLLAPASLKLSRKEWAVYLGAGMPDAEVDAFRARGLSPRPLGDEAFVRKLEAQCGICP